jgi:hypothetical protein
MTTAVPTYGSFDNFHKIITDTKYGGYDTLFAIFSKQQSVCATAKVDGSNLGITAEKNQKTKQWDLKILHGRNIDIWTEGDKKANTALSYGNAGALGNLPQEMLKFASAFGDALGVDRITVYGEAYKAPNAKFASWHPFGYRDASNHLVSLSKSVHALFLLLAPVPFSVNDVATDFDTMMQYLVTATTHSVFPPLIYACDKIENVIVQLAPEFVKRSLLGAAEEQFEGVFLVSEDQTLKAKFKTGHRDEQPSIPPVETLIANNADKVLVDMYTTMQTVYKARCVKPKEKNRDEKVDMENRNLVENTVKIAGNNVFSKEADFSDVPKDKRKPEIERVVLLVLAELQRTHAEFLETHKNVDFGKLVRQYVSRKIMTA